MGARLIVEALDSLPTLTPEPQPAEGITYAAKIDKLEARIDWSRPATEIDRQIRALSPFPGAWCMAGGERLKLLRSRLGTGEGPPGTVLDGLTIACGQGAIDITLAQREGKKAQSPQDLLNGYSLPARLD